MPGKINTEKLRETIAAYQKARELMELHGLTLREALRMQWNPGQLPGDGLKDADIGISRGKWLESLMGQLVDPASIPAVRPGGGPFTRRYRGRHYPFEKNRG